MNIVCRLSTTNMASVCLVCLFAYIVAQNEIIQFNMCHLNAIVTQKVFSSVQDTTIPASYDMFKKARPWEKQHDQCGKFTQLDAD